MNTFIIENKMTIAEVIKNYENGVYSIKDTTPVGAFLPETHIFDETLSAEDNLKLVYKHNESVVSSIEAREKEVAYFMNLLSRDIVDALMNEYQLTKDQALRVNHQAFNRLHESPEGYFESLCDLAQTTSDLVNLKF